LVPLPWHGPFLPGSRQGMPRSTNWSSGVQSQSPSTPSQSVSCATRPPQSSVSTPAPYGQRQRVVWSQPAGPLPHAGAVPAQAPLAAQKLDGGVSASSGVPLQSLSRPSHTSPPLNVQGYSQPFAAAWSRSTCPARQAAIAHSPSPEAPGTQRATANGKS